MAHTKDSTVHRVLMLAALAALAFSPPAWAQGTIDQSTEGYDLMKQIVTEKPRPNLLMVLDTSGSMKFSIKGQTVGVDALGGAPWATWVLVGCTGVPVPTATPTRTPTPVPPTATSTPRTPTYTPTPRTPTYTPTPVTPTYTPTPRTPTYTPTVPGPTNTPTPVTPTYTPTNTRTPTPVTPTYTPTSTPTPFGGVSFMADAGAAIDTVRAASVTGLLSPFTAGVASSVLGPVSALAAPAPALPAVRLAIPRPAAPAAAMPLLAQFSASDWPNPHGYLAYQEDYWRINDLQCTEWEWTLIIHQSLPSRMATFKNALGSDVTIAYTEWQPPETWPALSPAWNAGAVVGPVELETKPWVTLRNGEDWLSSTEDFDILRSFYFPQDWALNERVFLEWMDFSTGGTYFEIGDLTGINVTDGVWDIRFLDAACYDSGDDYPEFDTGFPKNALGEVRDVMATRGGSRIYGSTGWWKTYTWKVAYGGPQSNPGPPFVAYMPAADPRNPTSQTPLIDGIPGAKLGSWEQDVPPGRVIETSANRVNWGMIHFPTTQPGGRATMPSDKETLIMPVDTGDNGDITPILNKLKLYSDGGFEAYGWTPTSAALKFAQEVVRTTTDGGVITDINGTPFTVSMDPKFACDRLNAVILVTDGLSNIFNPASSSPVGCLTTGGNWAEPCLTCDNSLCNFTCQQVSGGAGCPEGGYSGYTCPANYTAFAAGEAEKLWNLTTATNQPGQRINVRTWVIGVSSSVGPCELNYTAYMGRTDAGDPNGQAGFDTDLDPYLPQATGDLTKYDAPTCPSHKPPHGHYAYFANSADDLREAILGIIGVVGIGDYTTAAPAVGSSNTSLGDVGLAASSSYPSWSGHIYALKLDQDCTGAAALDCQKPCGETGSNCVWDGGDVLSKKANNGAPRKLYTWDPTDGTEPYKLVEITAANLGTLQKLYDPACVIDPGTCALTTAVVDFVQGNDGSGVARPWKLGAILNSTPAVLGPPELWRQNTLYGHASYESEYSGRHYMAWVGSSDGMVHAFDFLDGAEILALLPPDLLDRQVQLYQKFTTAKNDPDNPRIYPVGQEEDPDSFIYGPAGSPRYADVFFPLDTSCGDTNGCYRTIMFLTEGPGGTGVHAIDITHPWGRDANGDGTLDSTEKDANHDPAKPVQPLWSKTRDGKAGTEAVSELGYTWSVPALGGSSGALDSPANEWQLLMGGGWDERIDVGLRKNVIINMDPRAGTIKSKNLVDGKNAGFLVYNQSFADTVIWGTGFPVFRPDNIVNQGVQVDLNGQMWFLPKANSWAPQHQPEDLGAGNPMYYPPAVGAFPASGVPTLSLYGFSTGSFYERANAISGVEIGVAPNFIPKLHVMARNESTGDKVCLQSVAVTDVPLPDGTGTLSNTAQPSAAPLIIVPLDPLAKPVVLFLVFDPLGEACNGISYIVRVDFDPNSCVPVIDSYEAGIGAAGGFAIAGKRVIVTRSFVGSDGRATILKVPDLQLPANTMQRAVRWWYELQ